MASKVARHLSLLSFRRSLSPLSPSTPLSSLFVDPSLCRPLSSLTTPSVDPFLRRPLFSSFPLFTPARSFSSALNSPPNKPHENRIHYSPGCDYEHWLVVMEDPEVEPSSSDEMIDMFIKTLARVIGSEEEARMNIYSISKSPHYAFGALVSEDISISLRVRWVIPDAYVDVENEKYGGEPFMPHVRREKVHNQYVKNVQNLGPKITSYPLSKNPGPNTR
ncbi:multiple organellar RNA editing factor 8, chloroplastic/mitochondrial-like isoform X2 [Rhododendron vialii]|uniref:multiple organellar RNA editing factor 8, chloroplastic/mitochondrial-like isoform X2 n=1 Tax=Rhododendron vialii TaxID=182163 RepID=UPI00265D8925|nr:multiple organellar RNA editing factor 8, chloroplastic/mitochondrial-like isoform X2 [Rhododendron vialii]